MTTATILACVRCARSLKPAPDGRRVKVGRQLCCACWNNVRYHDSLADFPRLTRPRDDLLEDYVILREQGYSWPQCAERLGMKPGAFDRAMHRARRALDPRAGRIGEIWPPREVKPC